MHWADGYDGTSYGGGRSSPDRWGGHGVVAVMVEVELTSLLLRLILTLVLGATMAWASLRLTIMIETSLAILFNQTQLHHSGHSSQPIGPARDFFGPANRI